MNFSPTFRFNLFDTILDINKFARSIAVRKHFANASEDVDNVDNVQPNIHANLDGVASSDLQLYAMPLHFQDMVSVVQLQTLRSAGDRALTM